MGYESKPHKEGIDHDERDYDFDYAPNQSGWRKEVIQKYFLLGWNDWLDNM